MLAACSGRVEHPCSALRRLVERLPVHGADARARVVALAAIRHFDSAARDHLAGEEQDLFPVLLESMAGSEPPTSAS